MPAGPRKQTGLLNMYQNLLSKFMIRATFSSAVMIYFSCVPVWYLPPLCCSRQQRHLHSNSSPKGQSLFLHSLIRTLYYILGALVPYLFSIDSIFVCFSQWGTEQHEKHVDIVSLWRVRHCVFAWEN